MKKRRLKISLEQRSFWITLLPILVLVTGSIVHYTRGYYGIDDAYISTRGVDDAYITYRYGWNLIHADTLSWNESGYRRIEGFTNPLWVAGSALWSIPGEKEWVYPLAVISSVMITAFLLWALVRAVYLQNGKSLTSIIGLIMVAAFPILWLHVTSGLESGVFGIGVATLAYLVIFDQTRFSKPLPIFALTTFLGFLRSDAFVFLGVILIAALITGSKSWKPVLIGLMLSTIIVLIWRYLSFGALLPNTAIAKLNFSFIERMPIGFLFLQTILINSGLVIFFFFGLAGLWLVPRRKSFAGLFVVLAWIGYYVYIGGDIYLERHIISLYFLLAAFSAPLWNAGKPVTRLLYIFAILTVGINTMFSFNYRFNYIRTKSADAWITLGKAIAEDRDYYGVLISPAAGKIPFFAGGDNIDTFGLNDDYLATISRDTFAPGHSSGGDEEAVELAREHLSGVYSVFSLLHQDVLRKPEEISLWIDNYAQDRVANKVFTQDEWEKAVNANNYYVWSVITGPFETTGQ